MAKSQQWFSRVVEVTSEFTCDTHVLMEVWERTRGDREVYASQKIQAYGSVNAGNFIICI
jgi:hypothetical protein